MSKKVCILGDIPILQDWFEDYEKVQDKDADIVFVDLWYNGLIQNNNVVLVSGESFLKNIPYKYSIGPKSSSKDILLPYFLQYFYKRLPEFSLRNLSTPKEFCCFIVSNSSYPKCSVRNTTCLFVSHYYKKVDACGRVLNNIGHIPVEKWYTKEHLEFMSKYKFCICFENDDSPMYHTEKIGNAYLAGCIPIYWGSNTCLQLFNSKAFLYLEEPTEKGILNLIEKIKLIDNDELLYQKMRQEPLFNLDIMNSFLDQVKEKVLNL